MLDFFIPFKRLKSHREKTIEHRRKPIETGNGASADVDKK
jgi:hypothetical protein